MLELPHSIVLALLLNRLLAPRLSATQGTILKERVVLIGFLEKKLDCRLRWNGKRFLSCTAYTPADVSVRAGPLDYLRLLRREVDADALFFQRRLRLEGDTELGLAIKNMLDALEMPPLLERALAALPRSGAPFNRH